MTALAPSCRLELFVGLDRNVDALTLNDPVKGELNEALYPLYGGTIDIFEDIAPDAYRYSVTRGRSDELSDVSAGTMAAQFVNYDATYFGVNVYTTPGVRIRLYLDDILVFAGYVDAWNTSYDPDGFAEATVTAFDALAVIAGATLDEWETITQSADQRFLDLLTLPEVAFAPPLIDTGRFRTPIFADTVGSGVNVLEYAQTVARTDMGYLYASRNGMLTFEPARSVTSTLAAEFADDGTGIGFTAIQPKSPSLFLYTRVTVTRDGGVPQTVNDLAAQALYGIRTLEVSDVVVVADTEALILAQKLLAEYSTPKVRIEQLSVSLNAITSAQRATVLALDLGDFVRVTWTPTGTTEQVQPLRVEAITIAGGKGTDATVTFTLSPAAYYPDPFLLDDAVYGELVTATHALT